MPQPQVSVIIPIYNGVVYIENICNCLSYQTFKNFEVVFINDGSIDNTLSVLESSLKHVTFSHIIISQDNQGVSVARNIGIEHATGEYVCFVDCDDTLSVDYIEKLFYAVESTACNVAVGYITRRIEELTVNRNRNIVVECRDDFLKEYLFHGSKFQLPTAIFRKKVIADNHISFAVGHKYGEDVHFTWRIYSLQQKLAIVQCKIYFYNYVHGSATNTLTVERKQAIELFSELEEFIRQSAPSFYSYFKKYAIPRQFWSLLWKSATIFPNYKEFTNYIANFNINTPLKKLLTCPDIKVSATSFLYLLSPRMYFLMIRKFKTHQA